HTFAHAPLHLRQLRLVGRFALAQPAHLGVHLLHARGSRPIGFPARLFGVLILQGSLGPAQLGRALAQSLLQSLNMLPELAQGLLFADELAVRFLARLLRFGHLLLGPPPSIFLFLARALRVQRRDLGGFQFSAQVRLLFGAFRGSSFHVRFGGGKAGRT